MQQRIVYKNENNRVSIVIPVDGSLSIEEIAAKSVPQNCVYKIIDVSEIPTDRTFRDAWEWQD